MNATIVEISMKSPQKFRNKTVNNQLLQSWASHRFALDPIRSWLVTHKACMPVLHRHIVQTGYQHLYLDWCLWFSSSGMQRTSQYDKHQSVGVKALVRQQVNVSMFNKIRKCCPQQNGLTNNLQRALNHFDNSLNYYGFSWEHFGQCLDYTNTVLYYAILYYTMLY